MTLAELNTYFALIQQLEKAEMMLENLQAAVFPKTPQITDMPRSHGNQDKVGDLAIEIADLEARIEYYKSVIADNQDEIEKFVKSIDDFYIKTIFRLRFERGLRWREIAYIIGGGNTEQSVKSAAYRYLKKLQRDDAR